MIQNLAMRTPIQRIELGLTRRPAGAPALQWLCEGIRAAIADGRLHPGTRLPSTRALALQVGLARRTVITAFEELQSQGYLDARMRSGTFVAVSSTSPARPSNLRARSPAGRSTAPALSRTARQTATFDRFAESSPMAFRAHLPAVEEFPAKLWARLAWRRLRGATRAQLTGTGALGHASLRDVLAEYLRRSRAVRCEPSQIAIVSGVQEALSLVARLVVDPGDVVAVEDPGYIGAVRAFESAGTRIRSLPVDGEGARVPTADARVKLVYLTPAHQFPLGMSMTLARRLEFLAWAQASGALLLEDDYDSEYRYWGKPLPSLQGLDRHGRVVFAGSFSKVLFPSIRLGYVVVPPALVDPLGRLLSVEGRQSSLLDQLVLRDFIADGHYFRHVRRMREIYGGRLTKLQTLANARLRGRLEVSPIEAGLQTAAVLRAPLRADAVARQAARRKVEVSPLSRYARAPLDFEGLLLGFGAADEREIARGIEQLAVVLEC
ncbi:MAG: PLP-dependent aminotransferase family protein [Vicinamibacterales bacterium]